VDRGRPPPIPEMRRIVKLIQSLGGSYIGGKGSYLIRFEGKVREPCGGYSGRFGEGRNFSKGGGDSGTELGMKELLAQVLGDARFGTKPPPKTDRGISRRKGDATAESDHLSRLVPERTGWNGTKFQTF